MKFRQIIKIILCILGMLLAYRLGCLHGVQWRDELTQRTGVYVYDTQQKLDAYYKNVEKAILDSGLPGELTSDAIDRRRRMRPLVVAGPIVVFFDDNDGSYEVCEEDFHKPFVFYNRSNERFDLLHLTTKVENDWKLSRFSSVLSYSKNGIYEGGAFSIRREDGHLVRTYLDTKGIGAFDEMLVYENEITNRYRLNGLSWEKVDERDHHPALIDYENLLSIIEEQPEPQ